MFDGYLKIKTKLDNKDIDKDVQELENKIKKSQLDNADLSNEQRSVQKEIENYEALGNKADEYKYKIKELEQERKSLFKNGGLPSSSLNQYNSITAEIDQAIAEQTKLNTEIDKQAPKIEKSYQKLNKIKNKQVENNAKISEYKNKIESINMKHIQNSVDNVGKGIESSIRKVGKLTLAVFGIRTAFNFVRSAISTIAQYNPQIEADINYIRYALASSLLPVIQQIVSLAYTLLSYINAIISGWFGINIFSNASAKNFQKMQSGASGTAKAVDEIKKSLQGFDEMNVLQDNSGSQTGSSGAGGVAPSMDLSSLQGEIPSWLQWIIDNKDVVLSVLGGIAAGIVAMKLGIKDIKALGIGVLITGIIMLIQSVIKYLNDPSWENFGKIITSIGIAIVGLAIIIGGPAGLTVAIAGAIAIIVGLVVSNWEKIKEVLQKGIDWLKSKTDWVEENFGLVGRIIYEAFIGVCEEVLKAFDGMFRGIKRILDGIIQVFKGIFNGDMEEVLEGFKNIFGGICDSIASIFKLKINSIIQAINSFIRGANRIKIDIPGGGHFGVDIPQIPLLERGTVVTKPTRAIFGENGAEMAMPLENHTEWMDYLADMLVSKMGNTNNAGGSYIIQLDGRTIQRGMAKRRQELAFATNGR